MAGKFSVSYQTCLNQIGTQFHCPKRRPFEVLQTSPKSLPGSGLGSASAASAVVGAEGCFVVERFRAWPGAESDAGGDCAVEDSEPGPVAGTESGSGRAVWHPAALAVKTARAAAAVSANFMRPFCRGRSADVCQTTANLWQGPANFCQVLAGSGLGPPGGGRGNVASREASGSSGPIPMRSRRRRAVWHAATLSEVGSEAPSGLALSQVRMACGRIVGVTPRSLAGRNVAQAIARVYRLQAASEGTLVA